MEGKNIPCYNCALVRASRQIAGKQLISIGLLMPNVVQIGQQHHPNGKYIAKVADNNCLISPDMMLILGTSLKAYRANQLAKQFAKTVKSNGGKVIYVDLFKPRCG